MLHILKQNNKKVLHINDMDSLLGKVELIDIRESYEYNTGTLDTAKNIPMGDMLGNPEQYLDKDKTYYIMCQSGARSGQACKLLTRMGYDVINVSGGMGSYVGTKRK